jgi:endoglucanase Acf2
MGEGLARLMRCVDPYPVGRRIHSRRDKCSAGPDSSTVMQAAFSHPTALNLPHLLREPLTPPLPGVPERGVRRSPSRAIPKKPMDLSTRTVPALLAILLLTTTLPKAHAEVVAVGSGSYTTDLPPGAKAPQSEIFRTAALKGPTPTNDWWSSVAWTKFSDKQYPHPLAVRCESRGLRVYYPGPSITANSQAIFGSMPDQGDLVLGHSAANEFPDARLDGFSDWFVSVKFADADHALRVSYGHGSPFVYALYEKGEPTVTFASPPKVWAGDANSPALGVTINDRHYALFAPAGSTWQGLGTATLTAHANGKPYFSLAILPDARPETLGMFARCSGAHVTDTKVMWAYDRAASSVRTTYTITTHRYEGDAAEGTLFALYPHQWRNPAAPLTSSGEYASVRGKMKLFPGNTFTTTMKFSGVLPALPDLGGCDRDSITKYLREELDAPTPRRSDTYWEGKWLGRMSTASAIADAYKLNDVRDGLDAKVRTRLEGWFAGPKEGNRPQVFCYNANWGTLIGYPASFGSDVELNDHHFHYGYFLRAAAEVAMRDPKWASDDRFGGMVKLLIRDIARPDRSDPIFPFLRNFDPYAGHSWAAGHAKFGDGNNNESSSEAMNAWCGLILWGIATGDDRLRDLGIYLYTTEMNAIQEYWFDVHDENHPPAYTPSVVTMIWGGKGANATWFTANPESVHGINFLPLTGGSLYLGQYPDYVRKNYDALVTENKGTNWDAWRDIIYMYRALSDPDDAMKQFEATKDRGRFEQGNSRANTYHWIGTLAKAGHVDRSVTADWPMYAVFEKDGVKTYVAYNTTDRPVTVTFSDGFKVTMVDRGTSSRRR